MSFVRPEIARALARWRETVTGAAAAAAGTYLVLDQIGAARLIGWALLAGGLLLAAAGIQRARFRRGGEGPGLVRVNEGQLAYFGPHEGGIADIEDVVRLDLETTPGGAQNWLLWHRGAAEPLVIPVDAAGTDALFDVFSRLPGIDTNALLAELDAGSRGRAVIWERDPARLS